MKTTTKAWRLVAAGGLLVSAAVLATGCSGGGARNVVTGAEARAMSDEPIEAKSATLVVHGMSCPLCANNVDRQLMSLNGVEAVKVNMGDGTVGVTFADGVRHPSAAELSRAIERTGFTLVSVTTP